MVGESIEMINEYRTFVWNYRPLCTSIRDKIAKSIPEKVNSFIEHSLEILKTLENIPSFFVIDVAETDRGMVIIELNEFGLSGRYVDNDFRKIVENIT